MKKLGLVLTSIVTATSLYAYDFTVQVYGGVVANMNEDITYTLRGEQDINLKDIELDTKPSTVPYYYGFRISAWDEDNTAWEFEHTHQKLYIDDNDLPGAPTLEHWEMTDGFNFFFVNKAWKMDESWYNLILRAGAGLVITHPDITYDGNRYTGNGNGAITYGGGYDLSGFVLQVGAEKQFDITDDWFFSVETRLTYANAEAEDELGGISDLDNKAFHLNYGIGYRF